MASRIMSKHPLKLGQIIFRAQSTMSAFEIQHKTPLTKKVNPIPIALYGGRNAVSMLPGGGIGPELMDYVREVFKYAGAPVDFEVIDIDPKSEDNKELEYAITSIKRNGVAIKGNIETKSETAGVLSRNVAIRNELDLYVNILHCKSYPGVPARQKDIDVVIIRQNTEGEYAMLEHESVDGVIESMKVVTESNSDRVARFAFDWAVRNGRKNYYYSQGQYYYAIFEPGTRNTGTAIAGKNVANPVAMLSASVDMLKHLGHLQHANLIQRAVEKTISEDKIHTPDLGGTAKSTDVVQRIIDHILQADIRPW